MPRRDSTRLVYYALCAVFGGAAGILLARALAGPFDAVLPVHSPLNAEGIAAVAFLLAMMLRSRSLQEAVLEQIPASAWPWILAGCAGFIVAGFAQGIGAPLLHDSYIHVARGAMLGFGEELRAAFLHPLPEDLFFRPVANLSYWVDYRWAGTNAARWHSWNVGLHLVNCALFWFLARRLSMPRFPATVAALVFGLHGGRPEVVSWAAARFDLLATCFTLAALLAAPRVWLVAVLALPALLSKEAAFCLPLLILMLIPVRPPSERRGILWSAVAAAVACGVVFAWRAHYLGGIGGYTTAAGAPSIFQFSALRSAKGLFYRQWAILLFPLNWSRAPGFVLQAAMVAMLAAMGGFLRFSRGPRRKLAFSLAMAVLAALPAQHLLLIGSDLSGARVLYLPVAGLALFWGFAVDGVSWRPARYGLAGCLLVFQVAALEHNLVIWRDVAELSQRTCGALGAEMARDPRAVAVLDLPATREGVFFLSNGFRQCVQLNSGVPMARVYVDEVPAGARVFEWSDAGVGLREVR